MNMSSIDGLGRADLKFDPHKVYTNWPQFVQYNPSGYDAEVFQDKLEFHYGENQFLSNENALNVDPIN